MNQVKEIANKEDLSGKNLPPITGELHMIIDLAELTKKFPPVIKENKQL